MWKTGLVIGEINVSKLKNKYQISIFSYMLSRGEGRSDFEKTVHAMDNGYNEFSARHSRPFLSSVFSSDFVCALHILRVQGKAGVHFQATRRRRS